MSNLRQQVRRSHPDSSVHCIYSFYSVMFADQQLPAADPRVHPHRGVQTLPPVQIEHLLMLQTISVIRTKVKL